MDQNRDIFLQNIDEEIIYDFFERQLLQFDESLEIKIENNENYQKWITLTKLNMKISDENLFVEKKKKLIITFDEEVTVSTVERYEKVSNESSVAKMIKEKKLALWKRVRNRCILGLRKICCCC